MRILTNGFPTNLPNSETVSQGGPANFARLFLDYILNTSGNHEIMSVMLEAREKSHVVVHKLFELPQHSYYRLRMPKSHLRAITHARSKRIRPHKVLEKEIARLTSVVRGSRCDVVFLNGFGILNWMLMKAAQNAGVPSVIQHAGIWTKELSVHKEMHTAAGRHVMECMEKESSTSVAIEIFLNEWSRNYYRRHVAKAPVSKTCIIPLPFDFASFMRLTHRSSPHAFPFSRNEYHIGVIARWDCIKNHKAVLAMARTASKKGLRLRFHSIVNIPENPKYAKSRSEYRKYVDVIPPVNRSGIAAFCRSVDMLMLPSRFDVSPTVVLEAIAAGTPIAISPTIGYVHAFMNHGGRRWIMNPANTGECLSMIQNLKNKSMPRGLTRYLRTSHDHKKVFDTYISVFERAMDTSKSLER